VVVAEIGQKEVGRELERLKEDHGAESRDDTDDRS
jgi:hypothetical protein